MENTRIKVGEGYVPHLKMNPKKGVSVYEYENQLYAQDKSAWSKSKEPLGPPLEGYVRVNVAMHNGKVSHFNEALVNQHSKLFRAERGLLKLKQLTQ